MNVTLRTAQKQLCVYVSLYAVQPLRQSLDSISLVY